MFKITLKPQRELMAAVGADRTLRWLNDYCLSAAVLGFAVVLARAADPDTFHLLRCMAATLPLAAGYNKTARASATGGWPAGSSSSPAQAIRRARLEVLMYVHITLSANGVSTGMGWDAGSITVEDTL